MTLQFMNSLTQNYYHYTLVLVCFFQP